MKVTLFIPCLVDQGFPETMRATAVVLERLGHDVFIPPEQTCCGQALFNAGFRKDAHELAQRFMRVFGGAEHIVAPSGSCVSMVSHHYEQLFPYKLSSPDHLDLGIESLNKEWIALRERIWEFSSFLVDNLDVEDVGAYFPHRVSYHASCHAFRELEIKDQPLKLLCAVDGLELIEGDWEDECCGFGGAFSVKYAELSQAMADRRAEALSSGGAEYIAGVDDSCLHNLSQAFKRISKPQRTMHIARILANGRGD